MSKKDLLRFLGKLNWCCKVVRGGRTFLRRLIDLSMLLKKNHHKIWLNAEAREDINWWVASMEYFHGNTKFVDDLRPPSDTFATDACMLAGGGHYRGDWFYVNFENDFPEYSDAHINTLELLSVLVAARRWGHLWGDRHIRVRCDNTSACNAINKGSSKSKLFMRCLRELFWLSVLNNFRLTAVHIKGEINVVADLISRLHEEQFKIEFVKRYLPL